MINFEDLLDASFKYNGEGPHEYDCWNLAREIYRRYGIVVPKFADTPIIAEKQHEILVHYSSLPDLFIEIKRPEVPCLVLLRIRFPEVTHCGVMITRYSFVQILEKSGFSVGHIDRPPWQNRIAGFYRYIGNAS